MLIDALHATLEDAEKAFNRVGMHGAVNVFTGAALRSAFEAGQLDMRERAESEARHFPQIILMMWDRLGGPPGNGERPSNNIDIAETIKELPITKEPA